jgi:hypothetical protein
MTTTHEEKVATTTVPEALTEEQARPWLDRSSRRPSPEAMTKALPPESGRAVPRET